VSDVEILPEQRDCRPARIIRNLCFPGEIDVKAFFDEPASSSAVLVMRKTLVVSAYGLEGIDRHQRVVPVVDPAASGFVAVRGAAIAEDRVLRRCRGALEAVWPSVSMLTTTESACVRAWTFSSCSQ